jgi:hypothetical protein
MFRRPVEEMLEVEPRSIISSNLGTVAGALLYGKRQC